MAVDLLDLIFNNKRRLDGARDDASLSGLVNAKKMDKGKLKKLVKMGLELKNK
jgi:hypothetical protein